MYNFIDVAFDVAFDAVFNNFHMLYLIYKLYAVLYI